MTELLAAWRDAMEGRLAGSPAAKDGRPADGVDPLIVIALTLVDLLAYLRERDAQDLPVRVEIEGPVTIQLEDTKIDLPDVVKVDVISLPTTPVVKK